MPSPGKGSGKGGGGSPLLTKIQLGSDTYTIGWFFPSFNDGCYWELTKIDRTEREIIAKVWSNQRPTTNILPLQSNASYQGRVKICIHRFCRIFISGICQIFCFMLSILILTRSGYSVCFLRDLESEHPEGDITGADMLAINAQNSWFLFERLHLRC